MTNVIEFPIPDGFRMECEHGHPLVTYLVKGKPYRVCDDCETEVVFVLDDGPDAA